MKKFFFSLFAFLILSLSAYSQWSSDPTVNTPVCTAANNQESQKIISDGSGGSIMVWNDIRNGNLDIFAQKFNSAGVAQWTAGGVAVCTAAGHQQLPQITRDGSGGAIITWFDYRNGSNYDIYASKINSDGTLPWASDGVAICTATSYEYDPQLTSDGSGGAIIAWTDLRNGNSNYDIYASKINSDGTLPWTANGVAVCTASNNQGIPLLISDGSGGAIITWYDLRNGNYDIYAQKINSTGSAQWATNGVAVCIETYAQVNPQLTSDGSGGAIITWQDYRSGTSLWDIYASKISSSGTLSWATDGVAVSTATNNQVEPQLTSDGSGGAIITWYDVRNGSYHDIYASKISSSGTLPWTANGVAVSTATNGQYNPQLASDGSGGAIIAWFDYRSGTNYDIYASKISSSGTLPWATDGVAVCTATLDQYYPQLASDGSGGAIITWGDYRSGSNYDIYAQNINSGGLLGVSPPTVSTTSPLSITTNSASSGGNVTSDGGASVTARGVVWGASADPTTASNLGITTNGSGTGTFTSSLSSLTPNTLYHVRAYATNSVNTSYGDDLTFTTLPNPPTCLSPNRVSQNGFTANWLAPGNQGSESFNYTVEVHANANWTAHISGSPFTGETGRSKAISGLDPNTTYYIRVKAVNTTGSSSYCETSATTLPNPPSVTTAAASSIAVNSANANGEITSVNGVSATKRGFYYNTAGSPDAGSSVAEETGLFRNEAFSLPLSSLVANTKYYVKAFAENTGGTGTGTEVNFTTLPNAPTCSAPSAITQTGFTANWGAPGNQGSESFTYTLEVHTNANWTAHISGSPYAGETGLSRAISGLSAGTQYFIRVKAVNAGGSSSYCETSVTTEASQDNGPTQQACSLVYSNIRKTSIDVRWTAGNGDGSFLVIKRASAITNADLPVNNTVYSGQNRNYLMAPRLGDARISYYGTGNICYVTGLSGSTVYYLMVCAYSGSPSAGTGQYNRSTCTNNPKSQRTPSSKEGEGEIEAAGGSFTISNIYPNPAKDNIEFNLDIPEAGQYTFEIYNEAGELFPTGYENKAYQPGTQNIRIGTHNLSSGAYTLIVRCANSFAITNFVIVK